MLLSLKKRLRIFEACFVVIQVILVSVVAVSVMVMTAIENRVTDDSSRKAG